MTISLKHIVPLALRTRLKWLGYALRDIAAPVREPRVPPRRRTFVGGGDFIAVGVDFRRHLERHGLTPQMDILDVGCGQGRMARPLVGFLEGGSYTGFDIIRSGIEWCQAEYRDVPGFTFLHTDVFNKRYNKGGAVTADAYRFPFEGDSFDLTFLTSVFTHMYADDVEQYLKEIARTLRPGGKALITWFLLDRDGLTAPQMDFRHSVDAVSRTTTRQNPEAAIGFDEGFVRELYARVGLTISAIEYGAWAQPGSSFQFQDMVIATKP